MIPHQGHLPVEHSYGTTLGDISAAAHSHPDNERANSRDELGRLPQPTSRVRRTVINVALLLKNPFRKRWPH